MREELGMPFLLSNDVDLVNFTVRKADQLRLADLAI